MSYGLNAVIAITVAGSLYGAQMKLFDSVVQQVDRINNLMIAAVAEADSIAPGYQGFLQEANNKIGSISNAVMEINAN